MSFSSYNPSNVSNVVYEMNQNGNPAGAVGSLSVDEMDVAMRYCFDGMAQIKGQEENGAVLLKWHAELSKKGGAGCIMRAMTMK